MDLPRLSGKLLRSRNSGRQADIRPDMSKSVIRHLGEILVCLVDEAQVVPAGVLDCIIGQFTEFASVSHSFPVWQS
jgi:hypothetical protein